MGDEELQFATSKSAYFSAVAATCICQNLQDEQGLLREGVAKGSTAQQTTLSNFSKS